MNFFRLRVLNTFLVLLAGMIMGAILRDKMRHAPPAAPAPRYQPEYAQAPAAGEGATEEEAEPAEEEEEPSAPAVSRPGPRTADAPGQAAAIELEPREEEGGDGKAVILSPSPDKFFKKPGAFAGSRVEMKLQIIAAQKREARWRLNFVHTGADRSISYLYVDDGSVLGNSPDLKVGYYYAVRFDCSGDAAEGNTLVSISPTGEKADWATGLSAVD